MTAVAGAPVVVVADGSEQGMAAVEAAASEAALRHRPLRIVHVLVWPTVGVAVTPGLAGPALQASRDRAADIVRDAALLAAKVAPEVTVSSQVIDGGPGPVLQEESRKATLLVLGDRGLGGVTGRLIGSVAERAADHGGCPVMVVRGGRDRAGPIVVGVDGSAVSVRALEFAVEEAALRGVELVALHTWTGNSGTELNDTLPMSYPAWGGDQEETRVLAEALAGIGQRYPDVLVRSEVVPGSARHLLAERSRTAQLVVVGDRGHSGMTGLLFGSVSQYLIHHAACPAVVVRSAPNAQI